MSKRIQACEGEIDGYLELGLVDEALKLAREILSRAKIVAEDFNGAMSAVLQAPRVNQWRQIVEAGYNKLSRKDQRAMRSAMLGFYFSIHDLDGAARHFPSLKAANHGDLFFMMSTLLDMDRLKEAQHVARKCRRALEECRTPFEQSLLIEALAVYHARIGQWDTALELWQHAPLDQPFNQEAITGVVLIHAARALVYAREGLEIVEKVKQTPTGELQIPLLGNEAAILGGTENALRKLEHALRKVVPAEVQKAFGLDQTR